MALSNTGRCALIALETHARALENASWMLRRGFANKLGNSISDGDYSSSSGDSTGRPSSKDASVVRARTAQSSMTDPEMLNNSLSEGNYSTSQSRRRGVVGLSSISDPETFWAGSSMSDGHYEMPAALRASSRNLKRSHVSNPSKNVFSNRSLDFRTFVSRRKRRPLLLLTLPNVLTFVRCRPTAVLVLNLCL